MTAQFPPEVNRMQDDWAFGSRCYAPWWNGRPDNGKCPASTSSDGGRASRPQDPNPHGMSA